MKAIILAGGLGKRIRDVDDSVPKPMIKVHGISVLECAIVQLRKHGIKNIIITVGYKSEIITEYFQDGKRFGVNISYFKEDKPLGSGGAIIKLKSQLHKDFIVINGDIIFNIDLESLISFHKKNKCMATIVVHPNDHPYDSSIIEIDKQRNITNWYSKEDERPEYYSNIVNAGIHILSPKILDNEYRDENIDLDKDILKPHISHIKAYKTTEYIKDMGTRERYEQVLKEIPQIHKLNRKKKQKAIFIDRDGTINKENGYITSPEQLEIMHGVTNAIRLINESNYLAIIVTNQPVIARGDITEEELEIIHKKLQTELGKEGVYIDDIYYCPHHPDSGYEGERKEYKIKCKCRKPMPGMLKKAAKEYNIDLSKSWMIGDRKSDILAGKRAGCKTILINKNEEQCGQDITADSLYKGVKKIIE